MAPQPKSSATLPGVAMRSARSSMAARMPRSTSQSVSHRRGCSRRCCSKAGADSRAAQREIPAARMAVAAADGRGHGVSYGVLETWPTASGGALLDKARHDGEVGPGGLAPAVARAHVGVPRLGVGGAANCPQLSASTRSMRCVECGNRRVGVGAFDGHALDAGRWRPGLRQPSPVRRSPAGRRRAPPAAPAAIPRRPTAARTRRSTGRAERAMRPAGWRARGRWQVASRSDRSAPSRRAQMSGRGAGARGARSGAVPSSRRSGRRTARQAGRPEAPVRAGPAPCRSRPAAAGRHRYRRR